MAINSPKGAGKKVWGTLQGVKRLSLTTVSGTSGSSAKFSNLQTVKQIKPGYRVTGSGLTSKASVLSVNTATQTITVHPGTGSFQTGVKYIFTS